MEFPVIVENRFRQAACLYFSFMLLCALIGCGTPNRFYDSEYEPDDFRNSAVAYLPIKAGGVHIEAYEAYRKSFNTARDEEGDSVLADRFNDHFIKHSNSAMKRLTVIEDNTIPVEEGRPMNIYSAAMNSEASPL